MRRLPLPQKPLLAVFAACALLSVQAFAKPRITGLEFPIGEPADRPVARVFIAELGQGAQKRGFFRVALLPLTSASGVQIRFLLPEPAALLEIPATLKGLCNLDAQEFRNVAFLAPNDTAPRLQVEEITPKKDHWQLKNIKWTSAGALGEASECQLLLRGPECGKFVVPGSVPPIPPLQELLQPSPSPKTIQPHAQLPSVR